jgi:hypothetical protein
LITQRLALERSEAADKSVEQLRLGDLALVLLTPREFQKLSERVGSQKITPSWSLPMRVIMTNRTQTVFRLRCPLSNLIYTAYRDRIRRILRPQTPGLKQLWEEALKEVEESHVLDKNCQVLLPGVTQFRRLTLGGLLDDVEGYSPDLQIEAKKRRRKDFDPP